jgi:hypothetical protein
MADQSHLWIVMLPLIMPCPADWDLGEIVVILMKITFAALVLHLVHM